MNYELDLISLNSTAGRKKLLKFQIQRHGASLFNSGHYSRNSIRFQEYHPILRNCSNTANPQVRDLFMQNRFIQM